MRRKPRRSKGINTNRSAQTAALAARRQHRIGRSAQGAAVTATVCSTSYSIGHRAQAAAMAAARRPHHKPQHWPQRAGHTTGRCTGRITCRSTNILMSASENYWEFNCTFSGKMQRVEDVVRINGADFLYVYIYVRK